MTLIKLLLDRVENQGDSPALQVCHDGQWIWFSWNQLWQQVTEFALVLQNLGVSVGNRVGILSESRIEWIVADLACHYLHAVSVPLSTHLSGSQLKAQIRHSGICLLVLDDVNRITKVHFQSAIQVIILSDSQAASHDSGLSAAEIVGSYSELRQHAGLVRAKQPVVTDDLTRIATIIYTSGTTGSPKGVMLTEGNLIFNSQKTLQLYDFDNAAHQYSFLPFFHAFARTCDLYVWLCGGHRLSLASAPENTITDLSHVTPTHINGVPYYFQRLQQAVLESFTKDDVWGDQLVQVNSGGASLNEELLQFYQAAGITMLEGYGLTETSPVVALNSNTAQRIGSVGKPLEATQVRISENGEIQIRGPHVTAGYYRDADSTRKAFDDGWLKTGDLGHLDDDGYLYITGRHNEMIVTTGGQNIWPSLVEMELVKHPTIDQAVVLGDGRDYLVALIHPDRVQLAQRLDLTGDPSVWVHSVDVENWFLQVVQQQLSELARHEQIVKVALMQSPMTTENDMLTPKGTLRRRQIALAFEDVLTRLYDRENNAQVNQIES